MISRIVINNLDDESEKIDISISKESSDSPPLVYEYQTKTHYIKIYLDKLYFEERFRDLRHDLINDLNNIHGYTGLIELENDSRNKCIDEYTKNMMTNIYKFINTVRQNMNMKEFMAIEPVLEGK